MIRDLSHHSNASFGRKCHVLRVDNTMMVLIYYTIGLVGAVVYHKQARLAQCWVDIFRQGYQKVMIPLCSRYVLLYSQELEFFIVKKLTSEPMLTCHVHNESFYWFWAYKTSKLSYCFIFEVVVVSPYVFIQSSTFDFTTVMPIG